MKAYSLDLRLKIAQAIDSGLPQQDVAALFDVSVATINRYLKQCRETGTLDPKPLLGKPFSIRPEQHAARVELWRSAPDASLEETCRRWTEQTGHPMSQATMCRLQQRLGWTYKKTLHATERDEEARAAFRELIAALTLSGIEAAMAFDGAVDAPAFETFLEHVLCPQLRPGQVMLLDNLASHKGAGVRALIEGAGCRLLFLPSYLPDFSPIEQAFAKIKQALRRVGASTKEVLEAAIAEAIELITAADARGLFRHCGYRLPSHPL